VSKILYGVRCRDEEQEQRIRELAKDKAVSEKIRISDLLEKALKQYKKNKKR